MKNLGRIGLLVTLLVAGIATPRLCAQAASAQLDSANALFEAGQFSAAQKAYAQLVDKDFRNVWATEQLGYIALLANQLDDAQKWLQKAIALKPDDSQAKIMLAEVFYRRGDFGKAAAQLGEFGPSYTKLVQNYTSLNQDKLASFQGLVPNQLHGRGQSTILGFVKSEPLPVVHVRINGSADVTFFIDTGGGELLLDSDFAHELGVKSAGSVEGTFSGGQKAAVQTGKIDSLTLGDWTLYNVPVAMMPLRQLSEGFGVKHLDGCIGTNVLYQFLATIDFPHNRLILRKKTAKNLKEFEKSDAGKGVAIPIFIAGDHFIVGRGQINDTPPAMLFVDTGLAGAGVKLGGEMLKSAAIKLEEDKASQGEGGGGNLKIVPYTVQQISLGEIKEENVAGLYDGPFPWEHAYGFYLAGMVGHDFFKPYAVTLDFDKMRLLMHKGEER